VRGCRLSRPRRAPVQPRHHHDTPTAPWYREARVVQYGVGRGRWVQKISDCLKDLRLLLRQGELGARLGRARVRWMLVVYSRGWRQSSGRDRDGAKSSAYSVARRRCGLWSGVFQSLVFSGLEQPLLLRLGWRHSGKACTTQAWSKARMFRLTFDTPDRALNNFLNSPPTWFVLTSRSSSQPAITDLASCKRLRRQFPSSR
jgi:hypothetical protein